MDHSYIEENSLIERYHRGDLEPAEEARFEAHFLECEKCTEELEWARGFRLGMKTVAAQEAAKGEVTARPGALATWSSWAQARPWAAACLTAFIAALSASLLTGLWLTPSSGGLGGGEETFDQPLANPPLLILSTLRGAEEMATLDFSDSAWVNLAVDVEEDLRFENYRLVIWRGGQEIWRREGLVPNSLNTLMVTIPAGFLTSGEYRLAVVGILAGEGAEKVPLDEYPFRVRAGEASLGPSSQR